MDPFLGQVILFAGNYPPRGWAFCHGQLLPISDNNALFSLLGTIYGGDGRTDFALPDLRGRAPIGVGQGPGLRRFVEGSKGGAEQVTLTTNNLPSHTHTATASTDMTGVGVAVSMRNVKVNVDVTLKASSRVADSNRPKERALARGNENTYNSADPNVNLKAGSASATATITGEPMIALTGEATTAVTVENTGDGESFLNRSPYLGMHYIIALEGIYPPRE